jgi:hypothetical protein
MEDANPKRPNKSSINSGNSQKRAAICKKRELEVRRSRGPGEHAPTQKKFNQRQQRWTECNWQK